MRVAFIGLGDIGTPIAAHLSRAFDLTVWNRTAAAARSFSESHRARGASTPRDAANDCDVVITCLPSSAEVEQVVFGPDGIAAGAREGSVLVDCTSGDPMADRSIAERLAARHVAFVDAPVSGGITGAESGKLTIMCGGEKSDLERVRPVLETFGTKIVHCGPVGAGHAVKAGNQVLLGVHIWATAEVLATLAKFGVSPAVALEVINSSSGRSNSSENLIPRRALTGAWPRTFRLALIDKDIRIGAALARAMKVRSPFTDLAERLFGDAHAQLGEEADHVEAVKIVERDAGVELRG